MPAAPNFGDSFAKPSLPAPYAQKRKGEPDQADGTKKSRAENSFGEQSSRGEWFGNDGSNSKISQSSDAKNSSFNFSVRKIAHLINGWKKNSINFNDLF